MYIYIIHLYTYTHACNTYTCIHTYTNICVYIDTCMSTCLSATILVRADKYDNKIEKFYVEYEELGHLVNRDTERENHESQERVA